ncbi:MAG: SDR family NAD(P)-dependent oxidoreductase [Bacteroidetes bacterium]|nr:SDR family NAD(P)-dependent oxidoreductase [Fibrella sp.]
MGLITKTLTWSAVGVGAIAAIRALRHQHRRIDFRGKTVVITGGARGLGLVMARQFAHQGAKVAMCARDEAELIRAKADVQLYAVDPNAVLTFVCDVTDREQVGRFIDAVEQRLGPVDVLVNNAGTILVTPFEHVTEADMRELMEANFWSVVHTVDAVLPRMRARRQGRIVNVASLAGKIALPHLLPYAVSKFAVVGYSEGIRSELVKDGIYVTTVCPGLIRTGSPRNAYVKGQPEKEYAWFKISDSLPLVSVSAETCARAILAACKAGQAELIVSVPAKLVSLVHGLFPELTADGLASVNRLLPDPAPAEVGAQRVKGKSTETGITQSTLTTATDEAALANNQFAR